MKVKSLMQCYPVIGLHVKFLHMHKRPEGCYDTGH